MIKRGEKIIIDNISKTFSLDRHAAQSALASFINFFSGRNNKKIGVLKNVSFELEGSKILGLIGRNGSGKSTLLKIIAGIYQPDGGFVRRRGKVAYLSGFGQGLIPRLTMRDNIFLLGSIIGLGQKDIKKIYNAIVDYSGLSDFVDVKVYQFSSGMIARLNFSIVIHCLEYSNPDIILLDEVFSGGGDIDFKTKAIEKMHQFITKGSTVVMVSHDLDIIKRYCHKAIFLKNGKIALSGDPVSVVDFYIKDAIR